MKTLFNVLSLLTGGVSIVMSPLASADFISDSKANLSLRNLYFNNDNRDGTAAPSKTEEWGQAFMLNYQSGFTDGTVGFGLDAIGLLGLKLDSGAGRHVGSSMFPNDGDKAADQWARLGATAKMRVSKTELRYGTLQPKLPILVSNDGRLLPQTFEGGQVTSNEIDNLTFTAGQLEHATGRASSDRAGLAVAGGSQESNKFTFAGGDYKLTKDLTAQYYYANLEDYYQQHFAGLLHVLPLGEYGSLKTDLRYFKTTSDGKNSSAAGRASGYKLGGYTKDGSGEIDNDTWSAAFIYSLGGHAITAGYQSVSEDSNFAQLNQGGLVGKGEAGASLYLYTDRTIQTFIQAGERTAFAQYAYDFAALGVPGLKASVMYLKGDNIQTASGQDASEWERDISLDYVIQSGTLKNLGFGWRNAVSRSEVARDQDQNRLIVSYSIPLM
ncbi:OprD family porin [Pseudomonas fluorescens]|uniref:OprD family porin n=1 Tax=Pseudomonas fluorescens TaxID=294 RepID=A0A944HBW3_PSEFL|nr:OprD family porin [Pseudomonas fluorescens]MBT2298429.1 OprD family porin [Pseudomonas fluorescens]MBT2309955.1 OprD family porin [Pseudomonas fluorescens]MBT2310978.1 OprD family porin [Pseudomonas fluorescens]MBT2320087.1 OprD family porin [Pseudomonas fluorescens]MBT2328885.1 OprD family porin [Pseudomonas fluorescens]